MKMLKLLLGIAVASVPSATQAGIILIINASNPAAVTFTATTATSVASGTKSDVVGFTMMNFFTSSENSQYSPSGGDLRSTQGTPLTVTTAQSDGPPPFGNGLNWNFSTGTSGTWTFTTGTRALEGSMTLDMTGLALPADLTTGDVKLGMQLNSSLGDAIGTWKVDNSYSAVPEPSSMGMAAGLALGGFALLRKRAKQA